MSNQEHPIFRQTAVDHYNLDKEKIILPQLILPSFTNILWGVLGMFILAFGLVVLLPVPTFVYGTGIISQNNLGEPVSLILLSTENVDELHIGQKAQLCNDTTCTQTIITSIDSGTALSVEIRERFGQEVRQPAVVATARLAGTIPNVGNTLHPNNVYQAKVENGSKRLISLWPLLNHFN